MKIVRNGSWIGIMVAWLLFSIATTGQTEEVPPQATVHGKYSGLLQVLHCPKDQASYGAFKDYGRWGGGPWCGQTGKAGYWVWVTPNWYVWERSGGTGAEQIPPQATVHGKYSGLLQVLHCPKDRASYGAFKDYGRWGGGPWCGQTGKAGYWVWVAPNWYVWAERR